MDPVVSDRERAERLESANADLERLNRELEAFAHLVAHDLKTPLQVVSGFLELLEERNEALLDDTSRSYFVEARRGAARMERLIDDLLEAAVSPDTEWTREPVDLHALCHEVLADYFGGLTEQARVTIGGLPKVEGSSTMLRRLLINLMSNAVKFSRPDTDPVIAVGSTRTGGMWKITVTDNGVGVPTEERDDVFAMYKRLQGDVPGSGIGLAICQRVVLAHGGRIWIEDGLDGGTQVCFTLPG